MPKTKGMPKHSAFGLKVIRALSELCEVAESGEPLESRFIIHDIEPQAAKENGRPGDQVRTLRTDVLKVSSEVFARFLGVSPRTLRSWEDGTRSAGPVARRFLEEIAADPKHWRGRMKKVAESASRS